MAPYPSVLGSKTVYFLQDYCYKPSFEDNEMVSGLSPSIAIKKT